MERMPLNIVVVEDQADYLEAIETALREQKLFPFVVHTINPCRKGDSEPTEIADLCQQIKAALLDSGHQAVLLLDHKFSPKRYTGEDVAKHFPNTPIVSISGLERRPYAGEHFGDKMYLARGSESEKTEAKRMLISAIDHADRFGNPQK